jgi:hypothetical protein
MNEELLNQIRQTLFRAGFDQRNCQSFEQLHAVLSAEIGERPIAFDLLDAALKLPSLFYQKPETLSGNVEASAARLSLSKQAFVAAALNQPQLFYQKPETLNGNVEASAARLGLTKQTFVAAALKQPSLFCQKPETLKLKKSYITKISEALGSTDDFASFVRNAPVALSCSRSRLHACYVIAKLGLKHGSLGTLVVLPSRKVEELLHGHYTRRMAATGKGEKALQFMHAAGLIKALPTGISPMPRGGRMRVRCSYDTRLKAFAAS